jgi:hypothetical protein
LTEELAGFPYAKHDDRLTACPSCSIARQVKVSGCSVVAVMNWPQRFAALVDMNGDGGWEQEHDRLRGEWLAAYTRAFMEIAVARGWRRGDAATWPVGIGEEAYINAYQHDWCPRRSAEADVIASEEPC